jgi:hypothetical protein
MNNNQNDEETALLGSSPRPTSTVSRYNLAKIALAGTISICLLVALAINRPTSVVKSASESFSNLISAFGSKVWRETPNNESNIFFIHSMIIN